MRIYTHPNNELYVNAITQLADGTNVEGRLYQVQAGLAFTRLEFQSQPMSGGCNGITNEVLLEVLLHRLKVQQRAVPCDETMHAIAHLSETLSLLHDREVRVERERQATGN